MSKILEKIRLGLLFVLPAALFCSYYPIIILGQTEAMNLELSIPLIWLVIFTLVSLPSFVPTLWKAVKKRQIWPLAGLLPLYFTLTVLWSANQLRALLTAGILCCLFISVTTIVGQVHHLNKKLRDCLIWTILITSMVFSIWCWVQCLLDIAGVGRDATLLCIGCTYQKFGFPHPSGLAIEPQFMGNLLIFPSLLALWWNRHHKTTKKWLKIATVVLTFFLISTLFLTFSRGAIYAFGVGLIIFVIWAINQKRFKISLILIPFLAFVCTTCVQGVMSTLSPTHEDFSTGIAKVYHQLSLGVIDFRPQQNTTPITTGATPVETPEFSGYVAASTDTRINLTNYALDLWSSQPQTMLFGVGLGGAGTKLHKKYPEEVTSPKEIVQNQFASILLETGLLGAVLALIALLVVVYYLWQSKMRLLLFSTLAAYLITLFFFSGLPNALQIYLWLPLIV